MIHRDRLGLRVEVEGEHDRVNEVDRIGELREPSEHSDGQKSVDQLVWPQMAAHNEPANGDRPDHPRQTEVECACNERPVGRVDEHRADQQNRAGHVTDGQKSASIDAFHQFGLVDQVAG